ncbi:AraC family transcriptional regulator [Cohnella sp. CFH 77786]|uniref:AraC family transcriptional regulator n=1 Tax=Cohnella sp. CFH 77786 TaxID=2662265 RepID=UPI001C608524|nr:AraC family transcriptional regulator [Cohnella sp. CFH 77786]
MEASTHWLPSKEHTDIPDLTFPINMFHLCGSHSRIIPPHWHDHLEWIAIVNGSFRVQVDTRFEDLYEGDVAFINTRQMHSAFPIGEDSQLYAVVFNEALLRNSSLDNTEMKYIKPLLNQEIQPPCFYRAEQTVTARIHAIIERMINYHREKKFGYELLVKASLFESLGHALQCTPISQHPSKNNRREGVIQPLLLHLSQHFNEPMSVEHAAQICCISPNYFCYLFKKTTGKTLVEYMNMLRVNEAEQLLRTRRYQIQQIAQMIGYSNMTYFGKMFKKFKNQTPREYMNSLDGFGIQSADE